MKKLFWFIVSIMAMVSCTFAINMPNIGDNISKQTSNQLFSSSQCYDWWYQYYHTWHNYIGDSFTLVDTHQTNDGYYYIYDNSTTVTVVDPYNVFQFNWNNNFTWKSNWKPSSVYKVTFVQKNWSFKMWNIVTWWYNGWITAQVAFRLKRGAYSLVSWPNGSKYTLYWFPYGGTQQQNGEYRLKQYNSALFEWLECFNYVVHYCWDGVKDTKSTIAAYENEWDNIHWNANSVANEFCDDWALNGQPWHCSITCDGYVPVEPVCGNWILETWEQCEPSLPSTIPTWYICNSSCQLEQAGPMCGNWVLETWEECEFDINHIYPLNRNNNQRNQNNNANSRLLASTFSMTNQEFVQAIMADNVQEFVANEIEKINSKWWNIMTAELEVLDIYPYSITWYGCDANCQLLTPTCSLEVIPPFQLVWVPSLFSWHKIWWANFYSLNFGDGNVWNNSQLTPYVSWQNLRLNYTYWIPWYYYPELTVQNNYPAGLVATGVTRPTALCEVGNTTTWEVEIVSWCVIEVVPWEVQYGEPFQVNYTIWWNFVSPDSVDIYPGENLIWNQFPYPININTQSDVTNWVVTTWVIPIAAQHYPFPSTWTYIISISWEYENGWLTPFYCSWIVNIVDASDDHNLTIEKTIDHEEWYQIGDDVHYTIIVRNVWSVVETNYNLRDVLPLSVTYVESSIMFSDTNVAHNTFSSGIWVDSNWQTVLDYTGLTLYPGEKIVLSVTWVANEKIEDLLISHVNVACLTWMYANICDTAPITFLANVIKDWNRTGFVPWDNVEYYITVQNTSNSPISYVRLHDIWPDDNSCIVYDSWTWQDLTETSHLNRQYDNVLQVGESFSFEISAHVANNESCARVEAYHNVIQLTYTDWVKRYKDEDFYDIWVRARELEPSALLTKTVDRTIVQEWDIVTYTITYWNDWDIPFVSHRLVDNWPSELEFVDSNPAETSRTTNTITWEFGSLATWETRTIILRWRVKELPNRDGSIINTVTLYYVPEWQNEGQLSDNAVVQYKWQDNSNCGNWTLEKGEECDGWYDLLSRNGERFYIIEYLDYNSTSLASNDIAWNSYYCTESCKLKKTQGWDVYEPVSCLNVNTNISVMENEKFPFRWRIWERNTLKIVNDDKDAKKCTPSKNWTTKIRKNTMYCTFKVYNGKTNKDSNGNELNTFKQKCFNDIDDYEIFEYFKWKPYYVDFSTVAWKNVFSVQSILWSEWKKNKTYWEYKLRLLDVEYEYCSQEWEWKKWRITDDVCEVDFALTKEYISQISTFGVTPKASNATDFLDDYYDKNGLRLIKRTDINSIISADESTYKADTNVQQKIDNFKAKYEWLAVSLKSSQYSDLWNVTSVKKVPNKSIYFIEWNWKLTLNNSFSNTPFTIVVKWMDIVVSWSVTTNGMFITDKTISFEDPDCVDGWQVVQWIFIAQKWFVASEEDMKNLDENDPRCQWWNLYVKWVLIWKNIENISGKKRSHLNTWFATDRDECKRYVSSSTIDELEECMKKERRTEIFQWASVLIEYNPSLWAMLPPGAEIFTETLEVYRK